MSIAQQEAGDDCAGQKNWGGSWCADGGPWEGLGVQMGPREGLGVQMGAPGGSWCADGAPGGKEPCSSTFFLQRK